MTCVTLMRHVGVLDAGGAHTDPPTPPLIAPGACFPGSFRYRLTNVQGKKITLAALQVFRATKSRFFFCRILHKGQIRKTFWFEDLHFLSAPNMCVALFNGLRHTLGSSSSDVWHFLSFRKKLSKTFFPAKNRLVGKNHLFLLFFCFFFGMLALRFHHRPTENKHMVAMRFAMLFVLYISATGHLKSIRTSFWVLSGDRKICLNRVTFKLWDSEILQKLDFHIPSLWCCTHLYMLLGCFSVAFVLLHDV